MNRITSYIMTMLLFCASCSTMKQYTSNINPHEVTNILLLEPLSYISLIEYGNHGRYDDELSLESRDLLLDVISDIRGLPITDEFLIEDANLMSDFEREVNYLCRKAQTRKNLPEMRLTPTIQHILQKNNSRFGLIIVSSGFTRVKGNYGKQIALGTAIGILSLGMYVPTPIKADSTIYAMIVDAEEDNIAFFKKSYLQDKEPLDEKELLTQIRKLFKGYFWTK